MKRSGPLKRTPLARGSSQLSRATPLRPRSTKRSSFMAQTRAPAVAELAEAGARCQIAPVLLAGGIRPIRCSGGVEGLHERRKRSSGGSLVTAANLIPACNWCNGWVEDHPTEAHELELVVREGDPEWAELGRRAEGP